MCVWANKFRLMFQTSLPNDPLSDVRWSVTHCKFSSLYTLLGSISAADFVFAPPWQLAGDRLTAHLLHKRQREREKRTEAAPVLQLSSALLHLPVLRDRVCVIAAGMCIFVIYLYVREFAYGQTDNDRVRGNVCVYLKNQWCVTSLYVKKHYHHRIIALS